jgi:hypothetical protein
VPVFQAVSIYLHSLMSPCTPWRSNVCSNTQERFWSFNFFELY